MIYHLEPFPKSKQHHITITTECVRGKYVAWGDFMCLRVQGVRNSEKRYSSEASAFKACKDAITNALDEYELYHLDNELFIIFTSEPFDITLIPFLCQ